MADGVRRRGGRRWLEEASRAWRGPGSSSRPPRPSPSRCLSSTGPGERRLACGDRRSPRVGATARGLPDRASARLRVRGGGVEWCVASKGGGVALYSRSRGGHVSPPDRSGHAANVDERLQPERTGCSVNAGACPLPQPPPVLVCERGQAPALTLSLCPLVLELLVAVRRVSRELRRRHVSPLLRLYKATPPRILAKHHSTQPPRTRRTTAARSGRPLDVAPTRGLWQSPQASCRSPGPLELKQLLGKGLGGLLELPGPRQALGAASSHRLPPLRRTRLPPKLASSTATSSVHLSPSHGYGQVRREPRFRSIPLA